jgi:hypothetical protein
VTAIITLAIALPTLAVWMRAAWLVETYGRQLRSALAAARRDAEHAAVDPAPLGTPPLRLVHAEESELLIRGAVHRHPAKSKR